MGLRGPSPISCITSVSETRTNWPAGSILAGPDRLGWPGPDHFRSQSHGPACLAVRRCPPRRVGRRVLLPGRLLATTRPATMASCRAKMPSKGSGRFGKRQSRFESSRATGVAEAGAALAGRWTRSSLPRWRRIRLIICRTRACGQLLVVSSQLSDRRVTTSSCPPIAPSPRLPSFRPSPIADRGCRRAGKAAVARWKRQEDLRLPEELPRCRTCLTCCARRACPRLSTSTP